MQLISCPGDAATAGVASNPPLKAIANDRLPLLRRISSICPAPVHAELSGLVVGPNQFNVGYWRDITVYRLVEKEQQR